MLNTTAGDYGIWCTDCNAWVYGDRHLHRHTSSTSGANVFTYSQDERMAIALERIAAALEKIANKDG